MSEINLLARGFADTPEGARYLEATQGSAAGTPPRDHGHLEEAMQTFKGAAGMAPPGLIRQR